MIKIVEQVWGQVLNFAFSPFLLLLGISPLLVSADERGYYKTRPQLSLSFSKSRSST